MSFHPYPADVPSLAFIGKAGAGKSTATSLLIDRFDMGYRKLSFAAPLKVMCGTETDRDLLQRVGVGVRELVPDGWVNLLLAERLRLATFDPENDHPLDAYRTWPFVVDDCRFLNEADALVGAGFTVVRITAPLDLRVARLKANGKLTDLAQLDHVSETALDGYAPQYTINNDTNDDDDLALELANILNKVRR